MATFLVVSFSERVMSFSVISCGFFLSRSSFCSVARFTTARFFCSIESGPSLILTVSVRTPKHSWERRDVHEVHDGYPAALCEHPTADARVVEGFPGVVLLVVRLEICGHGNALGAAHEAHEAGNEVVDVECACAGLHRASLGLAHLGYGHEKVRV